MYYTDKSELPATIREALPEAAQEVYIAAYRAAWEMQPAGPQTQTLSRESVAHQLAWDAVNREFVHDVKKGRWYRKGEALLEEEEVEEKGWLQTLKRLFWK